MARIEHFGRHVRAAEEFADRDRLGHRHDMVVFRKYVERGDSDIPKLDCLTLHRVLARDERVTPQIIANPLPERAGRQWHTVMYPAVHGLPVCDRLRIVDAVPEIHVGAHVVGSGLEHLAAVLDRKSRQHTVEVPSHLVDVEPAFV